MQEVHLGDTPILNGLPEALSGTGVEVLTLHLYSVLALGHDHPRLPSLRRLQIGLRRGVLPWGHQHRFGRLSPSLVAEATAPFARLFQPLPPALWWSGGSAEDYAAVREGLAPGLPHPEFGEAWPGSTDADVEFVGEHDSDEE